MGLQTGSNEISKQGPRTMTKLQGNSWFENCLATLGKAHDESVYGAIERLVLAGDQVGFTVHDLIRMLNAGMTLKSLLDLIEVRMTCASVGSRLPECPGKLSAVQGFVDYQSNASPADGGRR